MRSILAAAKGRRAHMEGKGGFDLIPCHAAVWIKQTASTAALELNCTSFLWAVWLGPLAVFQLACGAAHALTFQIDLMYPGIGFGYWDGACGPGDGSFIVVQPVNGIKPLTPFRLNRQQQSLLIRSGSMGTSESSRTNGIKACDPRN
jgi:hypothetical protein